MKQSTMHTIAMYLILLMVLGSFAIATVSATAELEEQNRIQEQEVNDLLNNHTPYKYAQDNSIRRDRDFVLMAKVVGFEVGWCCSKCQYYVASACVNRYISWYGRDAVAMISDGNDEYYYMNPEYLAAGEMNGFSFPEHSESLLRVVNGAYLDPADVYFWDNADTQGEWAELIWSCAEDGCFFYR